MYFNSLLTFLQVIKKKNEVATNTSAGESTLVGIYKSINSTYQGIDVNYEVTLFEFCNFLF